MGRDSRTRREIVDGGSVITERLYNVIDVKQDVKKKLKASVILTPLLEPAELHFKIKTPTHITSYCMEIMK